MHLTQAFIGRERKCRMCGKNFIYNSGWVYQLGSEKRQIVFCSWSCQRKWDSSHQTAHDKRDMVITLLRQGENPKDIARRLQIDPKNVYYWQKKIEKEMAQREHEAVAAGGE